MQGDDFPVGPKPEANSEFLMQSLDYWRLSEELNIYQTALLIAGVDPSDFERVENANMDMRPTGYEAAKIALRIAVQSAKIPAAIIEREYNDFGTPRVEPDWDETLIEVEEIKKWLSSRGMKTGFFFPDGGTGPEYLDRNHHHYAPKLAAAIHAWEAVSSDPDSRKGKTPKQALEIWLRAHANDYGLTMGDGNPNKTGIDDVSKIANWETKGGAPRTNG